MFTEKKDYSILETDENFWIAYWNKITGNWSIPTIALEN